MPFDPNIKVEESGEKISADSNVAEQADKITPTMPKDSPEAAFAKITGSKKVRGATPKPAEPVPDKLAAVAGAKFVGKIPWKE